MLGLIYGLIILLKFFKFHALVIHQSLGKFCFCFFGSNHGKKKKKNEICHFLGKAKDFVQFHEGG